MKIKYAEKTINDLQKTPFTIVEDDIVTDNGYVIISKEKFEKMKLAIELYHAICKEKHINEH